jgi:capsular polysaccharide biosynthesis protein
MAEQVMDTRSVGAVIRRGWRWITAFAVAGAALGAVYVIEIPPQLSSTTVLLLPASSAGTDPNQQSSTETQVHIAGSIPVFARAAKAVKPALTVAEVQKRVTVDSSISNLIEIHASSPEASQAEALSQAVADAYLATLKDRLDSLSGVPPQFTLREAALNKQLRSVREQIAATTERLSSEAPTSSDGIRDAQLQAELVNDQTDVLVRLDKVKDAAQQASTSLVVLPTLWQRASPADAPSQVQRLITWSVIGALLAAATAALVLVLRTRRDPRVRARDDLADAVGSSLLAVVHGHPQRSVAGWLTLLETYEAPAEEAWAFRQVLRALVPPSDSREVSRIGARATAGPLEHPRSLSVLAFSSDQRAIAIGPQLAAFAASLGIRAQTRQRRLPLRGLCERPGFGGASGTRGSRRSTRRRIERTGLSS